MTNELLDGGGATSTQMSPVGSPVQALRRPPLWYRDPISCLHASFAAIIALHGHEPIDVLGAAWEFRFVPGDVRPEEFYIPCRYEGDVGRTLAPYHPVRSRWVTPADPSDSLAELAAHVAEGRLPVAAVDNFHLPFRPAYHDVHAAHLVVVYGVDRARGLVLVSDPMPPAFSGPIPAGDFLAAWGSTNPRDEQDEFFSASRIDRRYLLLEVGSAPELDHSALRAALAANDTGFRDPSAAGDTGPWTGLAGLRRYVAWFTARAAEGDGQAVRDIYPFGWSMQAGCSLHGELLRTRGRRWDLPELTEAGRAVEAVAHSWTGVRLTAAHGWTRPQAVAENLHHHGARLCRRYEVAVDLVRRGADALRIGGE